MQFVSIAENLGETLTWLARTLHLGIDTWFLTSDSESCALARHYTTIKKGCMRQYSWSLRPGITLHSPHSEFISQRGTHASNTGESYPGPEKVVRQRDGPSRGDMPPAESGQRGTRYPTEVSDPYESKPVLQNKGASMRHGSRPIPARLEVIIHISEVSFSHVWGHRYINSHKLSRLPIPRAQASRTGPLKHRDGAEGRGSSIKASRRHESIFLVPHRRAPKRTSQ